MNNSLQNSFGNIDIYLFDQLLKGRFDGCKTILDIGCGAGRNIHYFLKNSYDVFAVDQDAAAVERVRTLALSLASGISPDNFTIAKADDLPFADASFDLVISSAVLHFANDTGHFEAMLSEAWRVLKPGGYFFARLASDIGIETLVKPIGNGRYLLPDGSTRYLVSRAALRQYTKELNAELYEPIKTTNVDDLRAMTTWCMRKT
jgi:SAM-dependent methyltransferase